MTIDRRLLLMSLGAAGLAACGSAPPPAAVRQQVMWPTPPELPRYLYEGSLRNAGSVRDESTGSQLFRSLTGVNNDGASFGKPLAVAARNGRVYVTDTEGRRVFVFDLPRRRIFSFGLRFEGELKKPAGIATDGRGLVYVVDSTARRVVVFDALGLYVSSIDGGRDWVRPTAIAVTADGLRIHVLDTGGVESNTHCVWTYTAEGRALGALGRRGGEPGEFNLPTDLAVGPDGMLWVLDAGNFRVQAFDAERRFVREFGSLGTSVGQLARPRGIAVDRDGLVYVSDASFCNVQVFQPDGQMLLTIGSRADRDAPGRYLLPARLACDETGRLYVVDQFLHKVEVVRRLSDAEGLRLQQGSAG